MRGELERVGRELNEARCDAGFWKMAHGRARQRWEAAREELRQAGGGIDAERTEAEFGGGQGGVGAGAGV